MKCSNHPRAEAAGTCAECGKAFCASCVVEIDHRSWCRDCLSRIVARTGTGARVHPGWRKLAAGLLSIIPGAGHMFLGLIGKGFALMGLLIVSVFVIILYSDATGMYWMSAYLIPTLAVLFLSYAVFDAMAVADAQRGGRTAPEDDETMKSIWERVLVSRRTIGWLLFAAGGVGLLRLLGDQLQLTFPLMAVVIPVILLVLGILLVTKGRRMK
jgi:hypothetical protein